MSIGGKGKRQEKRVPSLRGLKMYKVFIVAALAIVVCGAVPQAVRADPDARKIFGGVEQTNNTGGAKSDFHVEVSSDTKMNCVGPELGAELRRNLGPVIPSAVQNNNTKKVTFTWNLAIAQGDSVVAGVACEQEEENDFTVGAFFTPQSSPTDSPVLGWRVTSAGAVLLTNGYSSEIAFTDLRFQFPIEVTIDSILTLVSGPPTGTPGSVSSGTVPPGSPSGPGELLVDAFPSLGVGDFLSARLDTSFVDPSFSGLDATVAIGHEHQLDQPVKVGGGAQDLPDVAGAPLEAADSSGGSGGALAGLIAGVTAGVVALGGAAWYARRRLLR